MLKKTLLLALALGFSAGLPGFAEVKPVTEQEAGEWLYYALPLPHEVKIVAKNTVAPADIAIRLRPDAGDIEKNAAATLADFIKAKTGAMPNGNKFEIILGVMDQDGKVLGNTVAGAARLKTLPNNDQAYVIEPTNDNRLIVAALDPKGVFNGAQTLRQLLGREIASNSVTVPLVNIVDWPDFADRGTWNGESYRMYKWMSEVKLNYAKNHGDVAYMSLNEEGKPVYKKINLEMVTDARNYAFNNVPMITHLNFIPRSCPLYTVYPDLAGKGKEAIQLVNTPFPCPCASSPLLKKMLTGWLREYAKIGINEVSVWTSEYRCYCDCERCTAEVTDKEARQMVLEARAIVAAWREVQKEFPGFKVRILGFPLAIRPPCTNAGNYDAEIYARVIPMVMKEIPKDMIVEQVYSRYVRKDGKYSDAIDSYAAEGYKIVAYNVGIAFGFGAKSLYDYILSLYDRKWYGLVAWSSVYTQPEMTQKFASCLIYAVAEWGWNTKGRSVADFFRAWGTSRGLPNSKDIASWVELTSAIDYDANRFSYFSGLEPFMKNYIEGVNSGKQFTAYAALSNEKAGEQLEKAKKLAEQIGDPQISYQTRVYTLAYRETSLLCQLEKIAKDGEKAAKCANDLISVLQERMALSETLEPPSAKNTKRSPSQFQKNIENQINEIKKAFIGKNTAN